MNPMDQFEQWLEQQQRMKELQELHHDALNTEFTNFIDSLSLEQLKTLRTMVALSSDDFNASAFYGIITGAILFKHKRDWHGHDPEELLKQGAAQAEAPPQPLDFGPGPIEDEDFRLGEELEEIKKLDELAILKAREIFSYVTPGFEESESVLTLTDDQIRGLMNEYNLVIKNGRLTCAGCQRYYVSLSDRMLRVPGIDGCSGCQAQAGQG